MIFAPEEPDGETLRVRVLKVFDGDCFRATIPDTPKSRALEIVVRLGFIDAPELEQPGGPEAKDFLRYLIWDKWVELGVLLKSNTDSIFDAYKRIVAVPYLRDENLGTARNIELEMVLNGWAWVLDRYCPDDCYFAALEDAQRSRRGIWAADGNIHPWEFKKQRHRQKRERLQRQPKLL